MSGMSGEEIERSKGIRVGNLARVWVRGQGCSGGDGQQKFSLLLSVSGIFSPFDSSRRAAALLGSISRSSLEGGGLWQYRSASNRQDRGDEA
jgi:hypothetical protein